MVTVDYGENGINDVPIHRVNEIVKEGIWIVTPCESQEGWKVGDTLSCLLLENSRACRRREIDNECKSKDWYHSRSVTKVVDGWALISGTADLWLPPKGSTATTTSVEDDNHWKAGDILPASWLFTLPDIFVDKDRSKKVTTWGEHIKDREVSQVDKDGWAKVSGLGSKAWLPPKSECKSLPTQTQLNSSNKQSLVNQQKKTEHVTNNSSSRSKSDTGTRPEQVIVFGDPTEPSFERGKRLTGIAGQSGEQLFSAVGGYKGYGSVLEVSEERSY